MPDLEGQLTPEEIKKAKDWCLEKWGKNFSCEMCKNGKWRIGRRATATAVYYHGNYNLNRIFTFITVSCSNCGNTKFISLSQLGLFEPKDKAKESSNG